jgi:hypothetical protein
MEITVDLTTYTSRPKDRLFCRRPTGRYLIDFARSRHTNPARIDFARSHLVWRFQRLRRRNLGQPRLHT